MINNLRFNISRFKTEFRYSVLVNLQRAYPANIDAIEAIFIHIPKAAGTSLYELIGYTGIGHVTYRWYEERDLDKFERYFKFAFVRNPWDRLVSAFFHLKKGGSNAMDKHWAIKNLAQYGDFASFVKGWLTEQSVNSWVHFIPQHKFIYDDAFNLKVDYVGRLENIQNDFSVIAKKLNLNAEFPYIN
ncbi:MAG: sulfotransferase family protein [Cyanothece sp. SIO1E1]|nr:sulfotransferase family protein [Cyanothece sp. SIO1E1]